MKVLKITLFSISMLFLTVSGQTSDAVTKTEKPQVESYKQIDFVAHIKKGVKIPGQG
ncbi:hypothetical protein [Subsaximicrobium wynnwilliamsii]|uniref:hypothetical protein n=1 Tax=Subsaximicrobium wynnwilliamsii TaxID=291179 RepID=UPI001672A8C2|nr:hypothetical protein [Subsaximicrobium wynnwilliamsii]